MGKPILLSCFLLALLLWSCKPESHSPYAIKDCRKELQPYLTQLVKKGMVHYGDSLPQYATDEDLEKLIQSEHPILRMAALREMLERKSFDHFKVIMDHLNDTALVPIAIEEGGRWYRFVTDDMIENARWKNRADKNKTIDAVITKHNYLRAAYTILDSLPPQEKYYAYIKEMATRNRDADYSYSEPDNCSFEYALYGLAKFKKKEDIPLIKQKILQNIRLIGSLSFQLMKEFPDTSYLQIFEKLHPLDFYRAYFQEGYYYMKTEDYIESIAVYKNAISTRILDSILNKKQYSNHLILRDDLQEEVAHAVWKNPCAAYAKLREQAKKRINRIASFPDIYIEIPWLKDTSHIDEPIQW